jgi:folate-binding protein YgfZ
MSVVEPDASWLRALEEGRAFVDLSRYRTISVAGADAIGWLHDLLTADIDGLEPGEACRSLLLTPTGRIRADVHVARRVKDVILMQPPDQADDVGLALRSYVLSSDVSVEDRSDELALFALPGTAASLLDVAEATSPSAVGPGSDVLVPAGDGASAFARACVGAGLVEAGPDAIEAWRILRGTPRMGSDFVEGSLPAEAGLDDLIDSDKGCFLGQESIARVRNLGHPARVLRHLTAPGPARPGDPVFASGSIAGEVTSATGNGEVVLIARVSWDAARAPLTFADGRTLNAVPRSV